MKHTPKPLVEEHYHIESLINAQEKRSEDRQRFKDIEKARNDRQSIIDDAKMVVATDFHCSKCDEDFKMNAVLQVEIDWTNAKQSIAFYKGKHKKCGTWSMRLLTDKARDGFWMKSRAVRNEQGKYHNDLLQPYETGFNMLYGKR